MPGRERILNYSLFTLCYTFSFESENWVHIIDSNNRTHIIIIAHWVPDRGILKVPRLSFPAFMLGGRLLKALFGWQNSVFSDGLLPSCGFPGVVNFMRVALQPFNLSPAVRRYCGLEKDCCLLVGPNLCVPILAVT